MKREPVESKSIVSIGYDPATSTLEVEFKGGRVYHYPDFAASDHEKLMAAQSKGTFFGKHIKHLPFRKVGQ